MPERVHVARLDPYTVALPDCFARTKHTPDTDFMRTHNKTNQVSEQVRM